MSETWKRHPEFARYYVSDQGRVNGPRGIMTPKTGRYCVVTINRKGSRHTRPVHRLVLETFVGPRPDGMVCRHGCGGRYDNHVNNLSWGTSKQNAHDRLRDGTVLNREDNPNSKITLGNAFEIYYLVLGGRTRKSVAEEYGLSSVHVGDIVLGNSWNLGLPIVRSNKGRNNVKRQ